MRVAPGGLTLAHSKSVFAIAGCTHETMLFDIPRFRNERAAADAIVEFIERQPAPRKE